MPAEEKGEGESGDNTRMTCAQGEGAGVGARACGFLGMRRVRKQWGLVEEPDDVGAQVARSGAGVEDQRGRV